jgi:hypothetical protein
MPNKYLPGEFQNIAKIRDLKKGITDNPIEAMPVKSTGELTAEIPSDVQKTISKEDLAKKVEAFRAARASRKAAVAPVEGKITPETGTPINAPEAVKSATPKKFGLSSINKGALKAIPGLNLLSIPLSAKDAQEQRPGDAVGQAGIMAGVPEDQLPKTEEQYFQELRKRMGVDNPA